MADPISSFHLAISIIDAFKETYLVGKYIYVTIQSAIHEKQEREEVEHAFRVELLRLQTFGRWFCKHRGVIAHDSELDHARATRLQDHDPNSC